jgi:hypothetical protein
MSPVPMAAADYTALEPATSLGTWVGRQTGLGQYILLALLADLCVQDRGATATHCSYFFQTLFMEAMLL